MIIETWWLISEAIFVLAVVWIQYTWMFCGVSEGVRLLAQQMIEHPEEWEQGIYYFSHVKHKDIKLWTVNGTNLMTLNGNDGLTYVEKLHLNNAVKKAIALKVAGKYSTMTGIARR